MLSLDFARATKGSFSSRPMSAMGRKRTLEMGWREEARRFHRIGDAFLEAFSVTPPNLGSASRSRDDDLARVRLIVLHFLAAKAAPAAKPNFNHQRSLSRQKCRRVLMSAMGRKLTKLPVPSADHRLLIMV